MTRSACPIMLSPVDNKCAFTTLGFFCASIVLSLWLTLPIVELAIASEYGDQATCQSSIGISFKLWLTVKGAISIGVFVMTMLSMTGFIWGREQACAVYGMFGVAFALVLGSMFAVAWLFVGAFSFWRDCPSLGPTPLNSMMWSSLILGFLSFANLCHASTRPRTDTS